MISTGRPSLPSILRRSHEQFHEQYGESVDAGLATAANTETGPSEIPAHVLALDATIETQYAGLGKYFVTNWYP